MFLESEDIDTSVIGLLEDQDQTGSLSASTDENVNNNITKKTNAARFLTIFNIILRCN
jgi:hypothetical protein